MTRLLVPAGVPLSVAQRRLSPGYMPPQIVADGAASATSLRARATATASVTPHTKGLWTEIVAATTSDISVVYVSLTASTNVALTDTSTLLDIGIGAATAETVVIPNLAVGWSAFGVNGQAPSFMIPVRIPVGSRVAIRCQGAETLKTVAVQLVFGQLANGRLAPSKVIDLGTDLAASKGVTLATPGGANAKGAWTEIVAPGVSLQPFDALAVGVQGGADTAQSTAIGLIDVGYGASGSEIVLAPDLPINCNTAEHFGWLGVSAPLIPCRLPVGSRLAARWAVSNVANTIDIILYGIPA